MKCLIVIPSSWNASGMGGTLSLYFYRKYSPWAIRSKRMSGLNLIASYSFFCMLTAGNTQAGNGDVENTQEHLFSRLEDEDRWNLCFAAQKHILNDKMEGNRWTFHFIREERILSTFKLLVIPRFIKGPEMIEIKLSNDDTVYGLVITCSEWPEMNLRLGQSNEQIIIMLHRRELVFDNPQQMHTIL